MEVSSVPKGEIEGFRLSPQQKHIWSFHQVDRGQPYRVHGVIRVEGLLNVAGLKAALQQVIGRHEILRTTYRRMPTMRLPLQIITDRCRVQLDEHDLSGEADPEAEVTTLFDEVCRRPFDVEQGPLLHASLIRLSPVDHVLMIGLPALCADTDSLANLSHELLRCYEAGLQGMPYADEPLQYVDFSEWLHELLAEEDARPGIAFWRKQDRTALADLKLAFERAPTETFEPASLSVLLRGDLVGKIEAFARIHEAEVPVVLMACWQVLLHRLTRRHDMIIGRFYDGRSYEELQQALGLFARYLPVHSQYQAAASFRDFFDQVNETSREARQWQECFRWEQVAGATARLSGPPFFPFAFRFDTQPDTIHAAGVAFTLHQAYACMDRFKVELACLRQQDTLLATFHYDANLYEAEAVEHLAQQFQTLLEQALGHPEKAVGSLALLGENEREQLLVAFNRTQADYPKDACIHHLFEEQAARAPDTPALAFEDQSLTYAELNARANQLGHHLQGLGVGPDVPVALCTERSLEMVIGILGILKAGGAYVPLDPVLPKERMAFMLSDTRAPVLLTQQHLVASLPTHNACVIRLDADTLDRETKTNTHSTATPGNLVYVLYTSGSTGKPKGVAVEHRQLVNYVQAVRERISLPPQARFATVTTIAADLGNTAIFPTLCAGGCLHVVAQERLADPEALAAYFHHHRIDALKITPSHLEALMAVDHPERVLPCRRLVLGGEASNWALAEKVQRLRPGCRVLNHYGPTEATVGAIAYPVAEGDRPADASRLPLGYPLGNTQIYILNEHLQPTPIGVPGELHIGGAGLARGYLNRPGQTAERFIAHPFSETPGARLYRTGDLARYLPGGLIEFLGRIDHQVKIRGFRVELSEIEAVLGRHFAVREAVVVAAEGQPGGRHLVAYIVLQPEHKAEPDDLRRFLQEKLPPYMVPAAFVVLPQFPLTPNGKIDRGRLPTPEAARTAGPATFVAPRTPVEANLAEIWTAILGLEQVGIHDNFFELGGDSILSIQVVARAHKAGFQLNTRHLFQHQTIAALATAVATTGAVHAEQGLVEGAAPLTPIQHWFFAQNRPDMHHFNQSIVLEVPSGLKPEWLEQAVRHLPVHHDALRLRFVPSPEGWQQIHASPETAASFTVVDLSGHAPEEQPAALDAAAAETQTSLNLAEGPLLHAVLFHLGTGGPGRLLLVIHHLVVDGVSWRILLEDLSTAYRQGRRGEALRLPPKTTAFKEWATRLAAYAASDALATELSYWRTQSPTPTPTLPVDHALDRAANIVATAETVRVLLPAEETHALLREVPHAYRTTINDVLLTALVQAFARWTGTRALLLDLEGHGREDLFEGVDLSRTVGWFTTLFPVWLELGDDASPGEDLKTVKEQLRRLPNQGIGYGLLRYLNPMGALRLAALPEAQVRLNYLGQRDDVVSDEASWRIVDTTAGVERSPLGLRPYLLEVVGVVARGQLALDFIYSKPMYRRTTIERLADDFLAALQGLIAHCRSPETGGFTPSDFPDADLSQEELDELLNNLG